MDTSKPDRGILMIDENECKGCGLCVEACPPKVIRIDDRMNHCGYRAAIYIGAGCTGCGICFMACPEPGAITVYRRIGQRATTVPVPFAQAEGAAPCASN
jgi:2-oxoglutarate ferredoxin oxidoreductase subunit delta